MLNLQGFNDLHYKQLTEDIIPYIPFYALKKEGILALGKMNLLSSSFYSNIKNILLNKTIFLGI